jgi:hypothetical protein
LWCHLRPANRVHQSLQAREISNAPPVGAYVDSRSRAGWRNCRRRDRILVPKCVILVLSKRNDGYKPPTSRVALDFHLLLQNTRNLHALMHVHTAGRSIAPHPSLSPKICLFIDSCVDSWAVYTYHVVSLRRSKRRDLLWRWLRCREMPAGVVRGGIIEAVPRILLQLR